MCVIRPIQFRGGDPRHAFFTWALAKRGIGAARAAGITVGAALPKMPPFFAAICLTGGFGGADSAPHFIVPVGALLRLC